MASRLGMAEQGSPAEAEHASPNSYGSGTSTTSAVGRRTMRATNRKRPNTMSHWLLQTCARFPPQRTMRECYGLITAYQQ